MNNKLKITNEAITLPDEGFVTKLIFQRHCEYDKKTGYLNEESCINQLQIVKKFTENLIKTLSKEELQHIYFLFSASPSSFMDVKRCFVTTDIARNEITLFLKKHDISSNHILNSNAMHLDNLIIEPKLFTTDLNYLNYLKEKNGGINQNFWIDFEEDREKDIRKKCNAEGPSEIANRTVKYITALQRYSTIFHKNYPNCKLIIWTGTHYDTISPLTKRILDWSMNDIVSVEHCGGLSFSVKENGDLVCNINNDSYCINLQDIKQPVQHF